MYGEAAVIFYESSKSSPKVKQIALDIILDNYDVLEKLLIEDQVTISVPIIKYQLKRGGEYKLLLQYGEFTRRELEDFLIYSICLQYLSAIKDIHVMLGAKIRDLERFIIISPCTKFDKSLSLLINLGVSLEVVGERIAFTKDLHNIRTLTKCGYSCKHIAHDLIVSCIVNNDKPLARDIALEIGINSPEMYTSIFGKHCSNFTELLQTEKYDQAVKYLRKYDDLYSEDYSWVEYVPLDLTINKHIKNLFCISVCNLGKQILRRIILGKNYDNLVTWLKLATELCEYVSMKVHSNKVVYVYNGQKVSISVDSISRSKYSGLDMFSSEGMPLNTADEIRARRLELTSK